MNDEDLKVKVAKLEGLKDDIKEVKDELKLVWEEIRSKVSLKLFILAMTLVILFLGGILSFQGVQVWKIAATGTASALIQKDVQHVQEALKDIKATLEKLPGKLNGTPNP